MKKNKIITREPKLKWYTFEQVFSKAARSKAFRKAYEEEMARYKLASQIKKIRKAKRLTQEQLANKAHMPQSVIARMESGEHSFSLGTLQRVANVFDKEVQLV